jgi:hypothetical protein
MPMHTTPQKRLFQTPSEILVHGGGGYIKWMAHIESVPPSFMHTNIAFDLLFI